MTFYRTSPLTDFTDVATPPGRRKTSPFSASWQQTLDLLEQELTHLAARDVVVEIALARGAADIRRDGLPRSNARATHPGVRLSFESKHGPLTYATDRFQSACTDQQDWQVNLRAIALGLEALRKITRYGIAQAEKQYTGWKALPAGQAMPASHMTRDAARELLLSLLKSQEAARHLLPLEQLYRRARAKAHPDRHAGDRTLWDQVEQAGRVLGVTS